MGDLLKLTDYSKKVPRLKTIENFSNAAGNCHDANSHSTFDSFTNASYKAFPNAMLEIMIEKDLQNFLDLEEFFEYNLQISTPFYQDLVMEFFRHFCDGLLCPEESFTDVSSERLNMSDSFSIQVSEAFMSDCIIKIDLCKY
ncbi:hypothetical protein O6H91_Y460100 [Diphasiastrum complanatum]|nr:hypothetical protein O6H91_Y460100 [Diphasiastrum complanatum]